MKLKTKLIAGLTAISSALAVLSMCSAMAEGDFLPNAKFVNRLKVVDAKNKTVGFLTGSGWLTFKADNRLFNVSVDKNGLHGGTALYFKTDDCTDTPFIGPIGSIALGLEDGRGAFYERAALRKENSGYTVYYQNDQLSGEELNESFHSYIVDGGLIPGPISGDVTPGECQSIDWNNSEMFPFLLRPAKTVAKLPFIPPFSLK